MSDTSRQSGIELVQDESTMHPYGDIDADMVTEQQVEDSPQQVHDYGWVRAW